MYTQSTGWVKYASPLDLYLGTSTLTIPVTPGDGNMKTAAVGADSESLAYASSELEPRDNHAYAVVISLGTSDSYGSNRNADAFSRKMIIRDHPTYERFAHVFRNHKNKKPDFGIGHVAKSFFNPYMDRGELVIGIDRDKAPKAARRIDAGLPLPVSMGVWIDGDRCSICDHWAPKVKNHCKHMIRPSKGGVFGPNTMYYSDSRHARGEYPEKDGRMICVDNPKGTFFDISVVRRPADMTAYVIHYPEAFLSQGAKFACALHDEGYSAVAIDGFFKLAEAECAHRRERNPRKGDPIKLSAMMKKIDAVAGHLDVFKKDRKEPAEKKAQILMRDGVAGFEKTLKLSCDYADFPTVYQLAHRGLFGCAPTEVDIKMASLYQSELIGTVEESPALRTYIRHTFDLGSDPNFRHIRNANEFSSTQFKLARAESNSVGAPQKALCGLVAATAYRSLNPTETSLITGRSIAGGTQKDTRANGGFKLAHDIGMLDSPSAKLRSISTSLGNLIF